VHGQPGRGRAGAGRRRVDHVHAADTEHRDHRVFPTVDTLNFQGALVPVDPSSTPASAPLYNLAGNALNLTWGQFSSATAKSYAWTVTHTAPPARSSYGIDAMRQFLIIEK
jgi:hypothetical protein